ncbi:universal stress protein [Natrialbaceae archaeon A-CW2]
MFSTVLVPTDGSAGAEATIGHALSLAEAADGNVHALYVLEPSHEPVRLEAADREAVAGPSESRGRQATIRITDQAEAAGVSAARAVWEGVPYREILAYVDEHDVDLIVMGTHGRTGADRVRLGSTTERVITRAEVPVLSVRLEAEAEPGDLDSGYERIVVPTDGSDAAERAAETALDFAALHDATVHTVYVIDSTTYDLQDAPRSIIGLLDEGGQQATEAVAKMARERDLEVKTSVRRGVPAEVLLEYAQSVDGDLLAMGTRGQTVGEGRLLGSTTARVVRRSDIPVLTVT